MSIFIFRSLLNLHLISPMSLRDVNIIQYNRLVTDSKLALLRLNVELLKNLQNVKS